MNETQTIIGVLQGLDWRDVVTAASLLFGFVTLLAYWDQRRSAKAHATLMEFVRRNVEKDISEEMLASLQARETDLQEQIRTEIPQLARQAVIKEQVEIHRDAIVRNYSHLTDLTSQISETAKASSLEPEVRELIVKDLFPSFQWKEQTQHLRDKIAVIAIIITITSALFPDPIDDILKAVLAIYAATTVFDYLTLKGDLSSRARLLNSSSALYAIAMLAFIGFGAFLFLSFGHRSDQVFSVVLASLGGLGVLLFPWIRKWLKRRMAKTVMSVSGTEIA